MKHFILFLIISVLLIGCQKKQTEHSLEVASADAELMPAVRYSAMKQPISNGEKIQAEINKKKIIKDGRIGLKVKNLEQTKHHIDTLVNLFEGYYANESFNNSDQESTYNLTIRIPSTSFEKFVDGINPGKGELLYKNIDARDVTEQFMDLENRLASKKNYLNRYNELLAKAKSVKDILEIEEKIRIIQEELESVTGRLKYLSDQVNYSTINLMIVTKKEFEFQPKERDNFFERIKESVIKGWFGFIDVFLFLFRLWPLWILLFGLYFILHKFRKRKKFQK